MSRTWRWLIRRVREAPVHKGCTTDRDQLGRAALEGMPVAASRYMRPVNCHIAPSLSKRALDNSQKVEILAYVAGHSVV